MNKKYTITKHKYGYGSIKWYDWILSEYNLPDNQGRFQRVKTIANFGNTAHKENYQNAKKLKKLLEKV
jgi:hypothetical protein